MDILVKIKPNLKLFLSPHLPCRISLKVKPHSLNSPLKDKSKYTKIIAIDGRICLFKSFLSSFFDVSLFSLDI